MSCKFSIFLFLIHLYAFQIYGVFINKSFAGLHHHFQNSSGRGSMFYPLVSGYLLFKQPTIPIFFQHFRIKELSVPVFEKKFGIAERPASWVTGISKTSKNHQQFSSKNRQRTSG
jgi:hypothetical protein